MKKTGTSQDNKSHVLSIRLKTQQIDRLQRIGRQLGRSASEAASLLVEEGLRRAEFAHIDFRQAFTGRHAYITGSSLAVWEIIFIARNYSMDVEKTAKHLQWPEFRVKAAFNYAKAFPEEINQALSDNDSYDFEKLSRMLPQSKLFVAEPQADYSTRKEPKLPGSKKRKG